MGNDTKLRNDVEESEFRVSPLNGNEYPTVINGRNVVWFLMQIVLNVDEDELDKMPNFGLGPGVLIQQEFSLYTDEQAETNSQIIANVATELIKTAVTSRLANIELNYEETDNIDEDMV